MADHPEIDFDDAGQAVPAVEFVVPESSEERLLDALTESGVHFRDPGRALEVIAECLRTDGAGSVTQAELASIRQETIVRVIAFLCGGRVGARAIGRRVLLLRFLMAPGRPSQKQLARQLGVSASHASQGVKRLRQNLRVAFGNSQ